MDWTKKEKDGWIVLKISGVINIETAQDLKKLFDEVLAEGAKKVRLNLMQVPVSNSSGIGHILMLFKGLNARDGQLEIRGISRNLYEMMKLLKLNQFFMITLDE
jgi:anti-sigma B factor antagonist